MRIRLFAIVTICFLLCLHIKAQPTGNEPASTVTAPAVNKPSAPPPANPASSAPANPAVNPVVGTVANPARQTPLNGAGTNKGNAPQKDKDNGSTDNVDEDDKGDYSYIYRINYCSLEKSPLKKGKRNYQIGRWYYNDGVTPVKHNIVHTNRPAIVEVYNINTSKYFLESEGKPVYYKYDENGGFGEEAAAETNKDGVNGAIDLNDQNWEDKIYVHGDHKDVSNITEGVLSFFAGKESALKMLAEADCGDIKENNRKVIAEYTSLFHKSVADLANSDEVQQLIINAIEKKYNAANAAPPPVAGAAAVASKTYSADVAADTKKQIDKRVETAAKSFTDYWKKVASGNNRLYSDVAIIGDEDEFQFNIKIKQTANPAAVVHTFNTSKLWVKGAFKINVSAGIGLTGLIDEEYKTIDTIISTTNNDSALSTTPGKLLKRVDDNRVDFLIYSLFHCYFTTGSPVNVGISFGAGVGALQKVNAHIMMGASLMFGRNERFVLSAGVNFSKVDRLRRDLKPNIIYDPRFYPDGNAVASRWAYSWFVGLSVNTMNGKNLFKNKLDKK